MYMLALKKFVRTHEYKMKSAKKACTTILRNHTKIVIFKVCFIKLHLA